MKVKTDILKVALTPVFFFIGCSNSDIISNFNKLELELITLDNNGNEKNIFDAESNFTMALKGINNSDDTVKLGAYRDFCDYANENEEFFLIYKESIHNNLTPIGRPFELPLLCLLINQPIKIPPHHESYLFVQSWLDNPQNFPLEPGNYYSTFTIDLGGNIDKPEVRFSIQ